MEIFQEKAREYHVGAKTYRRKNTCGTISLVHSQQITVKDWLLSSNYFLNKRSPRPKTTTGAKVLRAAGSQLRNVANTAWIAGFPTFLIRLAMQNQKGLEPGEFVNKSFRQKQDMKVHGNNLEQSRSPGRWNNMDMSIQSIPGCSIFLRTSAVRL